ncbi:MAG: N-acetyltransferase [Propionibacteriaceae bacterium]|nr:N-acetyltransferase [Propionibacteriaceae bacterium]
MEFRCAASRFEAIDDGHVVGWLDFEQEGDAVAMTHTIVPDEYGGRGIGKALTAHAVEYAREHGWSILPYCTFIQAYLAHNPELAGLVPQSRRAQFSL